MGTYRPEMQWFGVGIKGGGSLFVVGMEGFEGVIWNAVNPQAHNEFNITSVRLGLGLGGGAGLACLCAFNIVGSMHSVNGSTITDWGVNVSLGPKWSSIMKSLRYTGFLKAAYACAKAKKVTGLTPAHFEQARNVLHYLWDVQDMTTADGPTYVGIDTPLAVGSEVSVNYLVGTLEVT